MNDSIDSRVVDDRVRVNLKLKPVTRTKIKVYCARRGETMQGALERILDSVFERIDVTPPGGPVP